MMNRRQINALYDKLIREAERIVFDAIAAYCKRHGFECVTNGPFGTMFTHESPTAKPGYSFAYGKYTTEIDCPKHLEKLLDWYTERFGPIPQAICKLGVWS
jgi:hypothetical protein